MTTIAEATRTLVGMIEKLDEQARIDALNEARLALHAVSPMKDEPVDCVLWVDASNVHANDWNPNAVAPPEMLLLARSIEADGYTQPIVAHREGDVDVVVDGFHRNRVGKEHAPVVARLRGRLPIVRIRESVSGIDQRMVSTVRHNRARGKHAINPMSDIVVELKRRNWSDEKIGKELGMDPDEVLRLSQITGLAEMFADRTFSEAWDAADPMAVNEDDSLSVADEAPAAASDDDEDVAAFAAAV